MRTEPVSTHFDAIVIGGSYAGMSAAMQLARARRQILVIDAGVRRNRFASASHGFLGQDGRAPDVIAAEARVQLLAYPTVCWLEGSVSQAAKADDENFVVSVQGGESFQAKRLVLATGVIDELPLIDGFAERWGKSLFHCPYCHGYELDNGRIGVLARGAVSLHHALMLPDWGQVTFFINGSFVPDEKQLAELSTRRVSIEYERVARITETATVELIDGRSVPLDGLFALPCIRMASPVAEQLGCAFEEGPVGSFILTDAMKATTIPGVFACGDAARAAGSVALAVGDGAQAGVSAHRSMIFR